MKRTYDIRLVITVFIFIAIVGAAVASCYIKGKRQGDFKVYYSASLAYREGLNPYDMDNLSTALHVPVLTPYVYPPDTLFIFRPLTFFTFQTAARLYLTVKLLAVCALIFFWCHIFDFKQYTPVLLLVSPLAFNGSLLDDLGAGNVSIFEQFFIWAGFYFYARDKIVWFAVAIILASTFKFTPIVLLGILATRLQRRDLVCLGCAGISFLLILAVNALIWPQMFAQFFHNVSTIRGERGDGNPAILALASDTVTWLRMKTGYLLPGIVPTGIYIVSSLTVLYVAALTFIKLRSLDEKKANLWRICLICFVYALILPRLKNYSYIVLIAPSIYAVISRPLASAWVPFCGLFLIYTYREFNVLGSALSPLYRVQCEYYSLIIAWVVAGLFCYSFLRRSQSSTDENADASKGEGTESIGKSFPTAQTRS